MKKYVFKPYSKIFPELFEREKARIAERLDALAIEHVGSTAVAGLGGKGIIDIAIMVGRDAMEAASQTLQNLGYEFRPQFSNLKRFYFIIYLPDPEEETRRYHIHLTYPESSEWKELTGFRDYLRAHPQEMHEYAELKRKAAMEANQDGTLYRKLKEPMFKKINSIGCQKIVFEKASIGSWGVILEWLKEPHIQKSWDMSAEYQADILIFMNGRKEPSPYWNGIFDYWIGLIGNEPYCLLMTSEILSEQTDLAEVWKVHLSKTGKTLSIDFMIGNTKFLGKGLAGPTLKAFTEFMVEEVDRKVDTFMIDPEEANQRAKHVYEKAGFHTVATFTRDCQNRKDVPHFLMINTIYQK